jgi:hypothetical protein
MSLNKFTVICQIFYFLLLNILNNFMLITRLHPSKKLKTTLPTHPERMILRLIPLLTPVNSRETLPLSTAKVLLIVEKIINPQNLRIIIRWIPSILIKIVIKAHGSGSISRSVSALRFLAGSGSA